MRDATWPPSSAAPPSFLQGAAAQIRPFDLWVGGGRLHRAGDLIVCEPGTVPQNLRQRNFYASHICYRRNVRTRSANHGNGAGAG